MGVSVGDCLEEVLRSSGRSSSSTPEKGFKIPASPIVVPLRIRSRRPIGVCGSPSGIGTFASGS